ncbi:uncharacterized protein LOC126236060 isoform X1 [Schistocerca nitens]|uniref:uncharacterized protein LOC126236060 isoform X1 n=2 Tax=Schistocerca nitens TaxID=7011 RepID=UPI002119A11D|nr:uncharacterized protein LOC126236060 isoform X1 [Schistocerca nitens]
MGEREHLLFSQKQDLLKRRKQLLDIKLQLQKDIHTTQPINFGSKYGALSEAKALSVADGLHHRFSDVRFLERLECHMLCGLKVVDYNKSKLVVQFRPSYLEKILPEVYAICLLAGSNGHSVEKYYLPHSVQMRTVVQRWSPLKQDNLKNFLLDIKQQINAFHHRQNQVLELKEWANSQNITLKVFHPFSLNYIVITARMDDTLKITNCGSVNLVIHYDSDCYLPTTIDIESSEMEEEELAVAKEQFTGFKLYYLREAFEICCIKTERFSLSTKVDVPNENLNEEVNDSISISEDVSSDAVPEQVNRENRLLPIVEEARKSKSELSAKGKRNRNGHNSSASSEESIAERSTSDAPEMMETGKSKLKSLPKGKRKKNKDTSTSLAEDDDIAEMSTSDTSEKIAEFQLQLKTKRSLGSVLQKEKKSKPKSSTKGTRKKKSPHNHSTNQVTKEICTPDQPNKITRYILRSKR